MRIFTLTLILFLGVWLKLEAQSNEGTSFWFGFMEHRDINENTKVAMITAKSNTFGTISIPGQNWEEEFMVMANDVTLVQLPLSAETLGSESITNTGIRIQTNDPVSVYIHQYFSMRSEATIVLPEPILSRAYYVMTYEGVVWDGIDYPSEFLVVATQDDTNIRIKVNDRTKRGRNPNSIIEVKLDAGETYQVQAELGTDDLTGSTVEGDKNFALFAGNRWTEVPVGCGARDNILEQMYPIDAYGKQFVTVPNASVTFDVFRILAAENNTVVEVKGINDRTYELNAGEFVEYTRSESSFIVANNPIIVAQFNAGSFCSGHQFGDPSMVLLNSIEQTRDTVTLFNSSFEAIVENYINVVARTADIDFVLFDGNPLVSQGVSFFPVAGNGDYSFARVRIPSGAHTIISEGCGVIATAYGYGNVESYAYSGGASFKKINANPIPEGGCLNDTIFFDTGLSPARYNFEWDLGDGTNSIEGKFEKFYSDLGDYAVQLVLEDECLETIDTFERDLNVTLRQAINTTPEIEICTDETLQLDATDLDGARYVWGGPNNFFSEDQFPLIRDIEAREAGEYNVVGIISGCATFPAYTLVDVKPLPRPQLGGDTTVCFKDFERGYRLGPGAFTAYEWDDGSMGVFRRIFQGGTFSVGVTSPFGCFALDTIQIIDQCPTRIYAPNIFSPNLDGVNDQFRLLGTDIVSIHLQIFDRWGSLIFETFDKDNAWDGRYNGQWLNSGTFVWHATIEGFDEFGNPLTFRQAGTVQLVR